MVSRKTAMLCCLLQVGTGNDLDLVLTKLAISENVANMLPIDGSSIGMSYSSFRPVHLR